MDAVYVHDAAALAAILDPSLFEWHPGAVVVVADGPAKGRTIRDEGVACVLGAAVGSDLVDRDCCVLWFVKAVIAKSSACCSNAS
jgi:inosine-uridine nucleoside N-ribohydrolase